MLLFYYYYKDEFFHQSVGLFRECKSLKQKAQMRVEHSEWKHGFSVKFFFSSLSSCKNSPMLFSTTGWFPNTQTNAINPRGLVDLRSFQTLLCRSQWAGYQFCHLQPRPLWTAGKHKRPTWEGLGMAFVWVLLLSLSWRLRGMGSRTNKPLLSLNAGCVSPYYWRTTEEWSWDWVRSFRLATCCC